jgi:hypothetical protein
MNTLNQPVSGRKYWHADQVLAQFEFEVPKMLPTVFLHDILVLLEIQS